MYVKVIKQPNGSSRLYIYESYVKNGKTANRSLEALGDLDELNAIYGDAIAHFKKICDERNAQKEKDSFTTITIDTSAVMSLDEDNLKNCGYGILKRLYRDLELNTFWLWKTRDSNIQYSADHIFRLLCFSRALYPASKKATFEGRANFFEKFDFTLDNVYDCLDIIADNVNELQEWLFKHSQNIVPRDMSVSYFDCTNYYFDIGHSYMDQYDNNGNVVDADGNPTAPKYQKRGPEKNHRPDPIVEMGLLMDNNGIPVAYELFPGNESEKVHMRPVLNRVKSNYTDTRIILVADRGLNTSDNIYYLNGDNRGENNTLDGYVYGQSVRGASEEYKKWVLQEDDYITDTILDDDGNKIRFKHKSRIEVKELQVNMPNISVDKPRKKAVKVDQKQMVYYSEKYAKKQKHDREIMIQRANDLIKHPRKYTKVTAAGSASYILNIAFDKKTGEVVNGKELILDTDKILEEEKYDGYYSIVTSELDMSDHKMRDVYRGLAKIEDTFKVTKSCLSSRPVYVQTNDHIDAHFAICFTTLVLIRILEVMLGNKYPTHHIIESLRKYCCTQIDVNQYQFVYYDRILDDCAKKFDITLNNKYKTREQIRRMLKY